MTDYHKDTGSSGDMMIRVNNPTVEFWINSGNSSTYVHELPWGYTVNGSTSNTREYDYGAGDGWVKLGSWSVTTDQTVTFRLFDTGTSGFGGPTTLSVAIDRASVPNAPGKPSISAITASSMRVVWTAGSNNGSPNDLYQVARSIYNNVASATIFNVDTDHVFTGLNSNTTYYYWARSHNDKGYSDWSPVASAKTISVPSAPDQVITSDPTQTAFTASFTENSNGGSAVTGRQLAYNTTNTTTGATAVTYNGVTVVTGLQPATTYYVWARTINTAGWSPWSPVATVRTIAGAWFNVNNVWKEAVPYVNVGGVWKIARPWSRDAGDWKETA